MLSIPTNCPICDSTLERKKDQLFCNNKICEAKSSAALEHFAKTMGIKGLGPAALQKLDFESITDIYEADKAFYIDVLGEAIGSKVYEQIDNSVNQNFIIFLTALGIPKVGNATAEKLSNKYGASLNAIVETVTRLKETPKNVAEASFVQWFKDNTDIVEYFSEFEFKSQDKLHSESESKTVCISGKLKSFKTKAEAKPVLEALGFKVVDSITKTTSFLISEDAKHSDKVEKAKTYGIPIVTIEELKKGI